CSSSNTKYNGKKAGFVPAFYLPEKNHPDFSPLVQGNFGIAARAHRGKSRLNACADICHRIVGVDLLRAGRVMCFTALKPLNFNLTLER
ncbi:MAG: hypothetical protein WCB93_03165, partial [Gallionella sp.]